MAKKSYIVQFTATTRIIVDAPEGITPENNDELFCMCSDEAKDRIRRFGYENYINAENAEITEDAECPYNEDCDKVDVVFDNPPDKLLYADEDDPKSVKVYEIFFVRNDGTARKEVVNNPEVSYEIYRKCVMEGQGEKVALILNGEPIRAYSRK